MRILNRPIAHRGLHDESAPENSMAAFAKAIEKNYNIETDVHLTKDGKLIAFHDFTLNRVIKGASGNVEKMTYDELCKFRLSNGEKIPLFSEVLELVNGKVEILCELKSTGVVKFDLEKATYEAIKGKPWVTVQAFNPMTVIWFKRHAPEVSRGQLVTVVKGNIFLKLLLSFFNAFLLMPISKPEFLAYDINFMPSKKAAKSVKKHEMRLISWTVDSQEKIARARENGVENIIFEKLEPENGVYSDRP